MNNINDLFFRAVDSSNLSDIKCLLTQGADIEAVNENGETALLVATYGGHKATVELLLAYNPNVFHEDIIGWTALTSAVWGNSPEIIELFIGLGLNVNDKTKTGDTALMVAVQERHFECIDILLKQGANINDQNNEGDTAINNLLNTGIFDNDDAVMVNLLIENGADPWLKNNNNLTPYDKAIQKGDKIATDLLCGLLEKQKMESLIHLDDDAQEVFFKI